VARIDHDREDRCGFPEVIYAQDKEQEQIVAIAERILTRQGSLFITRLDEKTFRYLKKKQTN